MDTKISTKPSKTGAADGADADSALREQLRKQFAQAPSPPPVASAPSVSTLPPNAAPPATSSTPAGGIIRAAEAANLKTANEMPRPPVPGEIIPGSNSAIANYDGIKPVSPPPPPPKISLPPEPPPPPPPAAPEPSLPPAPPEPPPQPSHNLGETATPSQAVSPPEPPKLFKSSLETIADEPITAPPEVTPPVAPPTVTLPAEDDPGHQHRRLKRALVALTVLVFLLGLGLWTVNRKANEQAAQLAAAEERISSGNRQTNFNKLTVTTLRVGKVDGAVNVSGSYKINGAQIASNNLSDGADLAKLDTTQTFSGANDFSNPDNRFVGDGSGLTGIARGPTTVYTTANYYNTSNTTIVNGGGSLPSNVTLQGNSFNGAGQLVQLNGSGQLPAIDGSLLTGVTATTLDGHNGAYYLDASNLNTGTISIARLPAGVTLQGNTFNGASQLVQLTAGGLLPILDGSNLTSINASTLNGQSGSYYTNASNISSGTLADGRLSPNVTLQGNTFNGASQLVQLTAGGLLPILDGSNLTNVNAAQLGGQSGSYYTNASNISSGTLADARLSPNVALTNAANNFTLSQTVSANGGKTTLALTSTGANTGITFGGDTTLFRTGVDALKTDGTFTAHGLLQTDANVSINNDGGTLYFGTASDVSLFRNSGMLQTFNDFYAGGAFTARDLVNSTTAFQIQNATGTSNLLIADTQNNRIAIGQASANYKLDVNGDVNIAGGSSYRIGGTAICTSSGCTPTGGSGDYIQNGTSPQTANFNITGNGTVGSTLAVGQVINVGQYVNNDSQTSGATVFTARVSGDANSRIYIQNNGYIYWGDGSVTPDTSLARSGVNSLQTAGNFSALSEIASGSGSSVQVRLTSVGGQAGLYLGSASDTNLYRNNAAGELKTDNNFTIGGNLSVNGNTTLGSDTADTTTLQSQTIGAGSATGTTATTSGTGTNTTTLTFTGTTSFANNDVIFIDNAGQDYFTRIVSGGNSASVTVSPAITFETARTVTKYNVQYFGSDGTNFSGATRNQNSLFQGYFTGGIVAGAGSTTYSDGNINSSVNFKMTAASSFTVRNSADSTTAFEVQNAAGSALLTADTSGSNLTVTQGTLNITGLTIPSSLNVSAGANTGGSLSGATTYYYRVTAITAAGESVPAGEQIMSSTAFTTISAPVSASSISANATPASISCDGSAGCTYQVTFVTANGETTAGSASAAVNNINGESIDLSSIPTGATGTTARNIYLKSLLMFGDSNYHLEMTINDNSTTSITDDGTGSTASCYNCNAPPVSNTARTNTNNASLTWTAVTGATSYKVYRGTTPGQQNTLAGSPGTNAFTDTGGGSGGTASPNGGIKFGNDSEIYRSGTNTLTANSSLILQASSNSATALQVLNASSQNVLQVDTSTSNITLGTVNVVGASGYSGSPGTPPVPGTPTSWGTGGGTVGAWSANGTLPDTLYGASTVVADGYIYMIGGYDGVNTSAVYSATISGNTIGGWSYVSDIPDVLRGASTVVSGGYIYVIGGSNCGGTNSCSTTAVYSAELTPGGTLSNGWSYVSDLPIDVYGATAVTDGSYIYVMGGYSANNYGANSPDVYTAELTPGGTLSNGWSSTTSLPSAVFGASATIYNGYIYSLGGSTCDDNSACATTAVYSAPISGGGAIGAWTARTSMSGARVWASAVSYGGYIYNLGGYSGATLAATTNIKVQYTGSGTIGAWGTSGSPPTRQQFTVASDNGYVYMLGGNTVNNNSAGAGTPTDAIYTATINGTPDIIGSPQILATPGSPGFAGTSSSAGNAVNLRVNGNGTFHSNTNSTTAFQVQNAAGNSIFTVDTTNNFVTINGTTLQAGNSNVAFGRATVMGGSQNSALGSQALNSNTGTLNTAVGYQALYANTTGSRNTAIGAAALTMNVSGTDNVALGYYTLQNSTGTGNVGIGNYTMYQNGSGSYNTAVGYNSLWYASGTYNTGLGYQSAVNGGVTNATAIGANAVANTSNSLVLGSGANVGIGNSSPTFKLDVIDNQSATYVASIRNSNTGNNADGLLINLGIANASRNANNYFIGFAGAGTVAGKIQGAASAVTYTTNGADYAEYFLAADPGNKPPAGSIIALSPAASNTVQAAASNSGALVGVVSESPGFLGNGPICAENDDNCDSDYAQTNVIVGMSGQLSTTVSGENGPIVTGDPIAVGSTAGVGVKATGSGQIVGYAMEPFSGAGTGTISVYINPGFYAGPSPVNYIQNGSNAILNDLTVGGTADLANLNVSGASTVQNLTVTGAATIKDLRVTGDVRFEGPTVAFSSNVRGINQPVAADSQSVDIHFVTAHSDADYAVQCTPSYDTTCFVTAKTAQGFTIRFGTAPPDGQQTVDWFVVR